MSHSDVCTMWIDIISSATATAARKNRCDDIWKRRIFPGAGYTTRIPNDWRKEDADSWIQFAHRVKARWMAWKMHESISFDFHTQHCQCVCVCVWVIILCDVILLILRLLLLFSRDLVILPSKFPRTTTNDYKNISNRFIIYFDFRLSLCINSI